jgi:ABC-type sugar transport system substrate-binding protein
MKKKLFLAAVISLMTGALLFAGGGQQAGGGQAAASGAIRITALIRNLNEQFVKDYAENLRKLAASNGVELNLQDANNDQARQLDQLDTAINQGYKYFVIIPVERDLSEQFNQKIKAIGGVSAYSNVAPTVTALKVDRNMYYASSPETVAGEYQGGIIADYFDKYPDKAPGKTLNMLYIRGMDGYSATKFREIGMQNELKKRGYTVKYIAADTANWAPDQAQQKMDAWLAAYKGQFNVVVAQNDGMALGAVESLIANGYTKSDSSDGTILQYPVLGVDATQDALNSMGENKLYATVLQDAIGQSSTAFGIVLEFAKTGDVYGKTIYNLTPPKTPLSEDPFDDAAVIGQCYAVPFVPVTKANYKDYLAK